MSESALLTGWRQHLAGAEGGLHLADSTHPLQFFVGKSGDDAPRVVVRSTDKPVKPTLSDLVLVERYEDQSGKWNLSLTLQDLQFNEVFLRLTDDLHARSAGAPNPSVALDRLNSALDEWRRLLKPRSLGLLSMEELRGLVGELWLLDSEFCTERSALAAVEGWLGPMGLPQDFWYADKGYCEAKSIGPSAVHIKISSEHQLDVMDLELRVLTVGNTDESSAGAVNLPTLVNRIKSKLTMMAANADGIDARLQRLGVELSQSFYVETWFQVSRLTSYQVTDSFPAIRASTLPSGVNRVLYQLDLTSIEDFKVSSVEVS